MSKLEFYKISWLEKILGKNYKYYYIWLNSLKSRTTYKVDTLLFAAGHIIILSGTILTWFAASGSSWDQDFESRLTYFILGTIFLALTTSWASFYGYEIKKGNHSKKLLYPTNFFAYSYFYFAGQAFYQSFIQLVLLFSTSFIWLSWIQSISSWTSVGYILALVPAGVLLKFFLELCIAFLAFFMTEINGVILNFDFLGNILSGRLFPLGLLVSSFWPNLLNPFAYLFYHPVQIYLGEYTTSEVWLVVLFGYILVGFLYFFTKLIFVLGLKKNESVGL